MINGETLTSSTKTNMVGMQELSFRVWPKLKQNVHETGNLEIYNKCHNFPQKKCKELFVLLWFLANQISFMRFWRIYHNLKWTHTTRSYSNVTEFINNEWMTICVAISLHVPYRPHNLKSRCADFTPVWLSCWEQLWLILYIV